MSKIRKVITASFSEFRDNTRLQWMLFAVLIIFYMLTATELSRFIEDMRSDASETATLSSRIKTISNRPLDKTVLKKMGEITEQRLSMLPRASSASVAEALALQELEELYNPIISKKRLTLLSSEELRTNAYSFWQIKVEASGRLEISNLVDLLDAFDASQMSRRISAFSYKPNASNTISLVADLLYLENSDE